MSRQSPLRTCIGCRQRAAAAELLRIVVMSEAPGQVTEPTARSRSDNLDAGPVALSTLLAVPDPRRRKPGRGAWVHPRPDCVDLAQRRRAFGRAFRVTAPIDPTRLREYVS